MAPETHRLTPAGAGRHEASWVSLEETSMTVLPGWLTSGQDDPLRAQHPSKTVSSEMDRPNSQPASWCLQQGSDAARQRAGPTSLIICLMESPRLNPSRKWIFGGSHPHAQSSHVTQSEWITALGVYTRGNLAIRLHYLASAGAKRPWSICHQC